MCLEKILPMDNQQLGERNKKRLQVYVLHGTVNVVFNIVILYLYWQTKEKLCISSVSDTNRFIIYTSMYCSKYRPYQAVEYKL